LKEKVICDAKRNPWCRSDINTFCIDNVGVASVNIFIDFGVEERGPTNEHGSIDDGFEDGITQSLGGTEHWCDHDRGHVERRIPPPRTIQLREKDRAQMDDTYWKTC